MNKRLTFAERQQAARRECDKQAHIAGLRKVHEAGQTLGLLYGLAYGLIIGIVVTVALCGLAGC